MAATIATVAGKLVLVVSVAALALMLSLPAEAAGTHNITAILEGFPEYSMYNSYLTQTKVCDEINSRETITCLVLDNGAMNGLVANRPLAAIKNELRLLTLLDYFDAPKIHGLPHGTTLSTTLLQTTGSMAGNLGFVNITNLRGGKVGFASTAPGSKFDSTYTKSVKQIPYSLSVLGVSAPIVFPSLLDVPTASSSNLTALLEKAGCKTFASLIASSGVLKMFQVAMDKGLTLFAPNDEAFKAPGVPDLSSLSSAELVTILQYHALPSYTPKATLKTTNGRIATMASSGAGKYDLSVKSSGDDVSLDTGVDTSRIASTILDDTPVCILTVDNVLLPEELFGAGPAPATGPTAPTTAPSPSVEAPASAPGAKAPSPRPHSPPAPPTGSPSDSPAESPVEAADKAGLKSFAARQAASAGTLAALLVALASWAISSPPSSSSSLL